MSEIGDANDIPYARCFCEASDRYGVEVRLLIAIAKVESDFNMNAVNINKNGSMDYGVMQINSRWKSRLASLGISWHEVIASACMNIHVGAWILATNFQSWGVSWNSVGAYNAGFSDAVELHIRRSRFAARVRRLSRALANDCPS